MVSVPDFDPNNPKEAHDPDRINRLTTGVYELGSTFKAFTLAMELDSGRADLNSLWDARGPLHYGKFTIHDDEPKGRFLNMKEVFTFSSNVGAARMALSQGVEAHKAFLRKMGQMDRLRTELPESASPILPKRWSELNTVTIAFGHGIAVAPLQAVMGIDALVNGGYLIPPTFLKRSEQEAMALAKRVIKPETSEKMRFLMRLNAEIGTARKPTSRVTTSAARPEPPRRSSTAATPRNACSPPSPPSCPPIIPATSFWSCWTSRSR